MHAGTCIKLFVFVLVLSQVMWMILTQICGGRMCWTIHFLKMGHFCTWQLRYDDSHSCCLLLFVSVESTWMLRQLHKYFPLLCPRAIDQIYGWSVRSHLAYLCNIQFSMSSWQLFNQSELMFPSCPLLFTQQAILCHCTLSWTSWNQLTYV